MIKLKIKYGNESTDIRFPCKETEMSAALERIHAEDVTPLELYVTGVVFPEELGCLQDRFVNLDEVNFLGKRMDGFFGDEEYQFYEAMKSEGFDTLPDLVNLSFNLDRYPLIRDISDMGKIGREYLLTADIRLWNCCKHHINNGCIFFENIKLRNCSERAYTLYCAAKDLTLGTKHITISDLADIKLVPPVLFRIICNAMAIRRFGLAAVKL